MKQKTEKKHTILKVIISIIILAVIFIATIMLVPDQKLLSASSLIHYVNHVFGGDSSVGENFEFEASIDNVFAQMNGMLVVGSGSGLQLFDKEGNEVVSGRYTLSSPAVDAGSKKAALWDIGGNELSIVSRTGDIKDILFEGALISVSVNSNDWIAVSAEEAGYKGVVTVYDKNGSAVYKWYSGEGYLIDADISPDCGEMTAATLTKAGSRIVSFKLDSESEKSSYTSDSQLIFDIGYISDNMIGILSETALTLLNKDLEFVKEYNYSDEYLKDYSLDGNGFVVLLLGKYKAGGTNRLVTVDLSGRELGSIDIEGEVLSISANGRYLAVVYKDRTVVYTSNLKVYGQLTDSIGVKKALMCKDGTAIIISGYGAAVFMP